MPAARHRLATTIAVALLGAAAGPSAAGAAEATWADLKPLATSQPVQTHQAHGEEKAIMIAVPGGGWGAGGQELFDLFGYVDWWVKMLQDEGITVDVVGHRGASGPGTVARQIADVVDAMERARKRAPSTPLCIYGLSSGGHLAAMASIVRPDLTKCVVADGAPLVLDVWLAQVTWLRNLRVDDWVYSLTYPGAAQERFNSPEFPDGLTRFDPGRQAHRIGHLFSINAAKNPDGTEADHSVGSEQGELMRRRIPDRTTVAYVHAAADGEPELTSAHFLYSSFFDLSRGGAKADEARQVYGRAARWALANATPPAKARTPVAPAPAPAAEPTRAPTPQARISGRTLRLNERGRVLAKLRCTDRSTGCRVDLRVRAAGSWSRTVRTRLPKGGRTRAVAITLSARQRRAIARHGRTRAQLRVIVRAPRPDGAQRFLRVFLTPPPSATR